MGKNYESMLIMISAFPWRLNRLLVNYCSLLFVRLLYDFDLSCSHKLLAGGGGEKVKVIDILNKK